MTLPARQAGPIVAVPSVPSRSRQPFVGGFPFGTGIPVDESAPTVEINIPPQVVVVPEAGAVPDPPPAPVASAPVRRYVPGPGPKIVTVPGQEPSASECSHTVTIYRGSAVEVQSFPISPCPSANTGSKAPTGAKTATSSKTSSKKPLPPS